MALGRYSRVDGRKLSSNYCSTLTATIFIGVCLLGVWLLASSPVSPVQNLDAENTHDNVKIPASRSSDDSVEDTSKLSNSNANDVNEKGNAKVNDGTGKSIDLDGEETMKFDGNLGDFSENAVKEDNTLISSQEVKNDEPQEVSSDKEPGYEDVKKINEQEEDRPKTAEEVTGNVEFQVETNATESSEGREDIFEDNQTNMDNGEEGKVEKTTDNHEDAKLDHGLVEKSDNSTEVFPSDVKMEQGLVEKNGNSTEAFPYGAGSELADEAKVQNGSFSTQSTESKNEKEAQKSAEYESQSSYTWRLCNTTAGIDYIPCLDNVEAIRKLRSTKHYEHRERHCPKNPPTCLVPLPEGYKQSIPWPTSREKIWYRNVPHTQLVEFKGHQNWLKVSGEYLTFPGGGTQFIHGALHYIDFIQQSVSEISWGKRSRVVLDVGCGVASFGGFLFDRDVLTMSLAPKDEHEAQVQFALERGIPAISAVMGTLRLPFPGRVFDVVHCARCRVPWHIEGGKLLLELNRLLRPGGFFVWSATPIYQKVPEDVQIWQEMEKLTKAMCWEVVSIIRDKLNGVGIAIYRKPTSNDCYEQRSINVPPLCQDSDDANAAWSVPLQACMHKVPTSETERGSQWPEMWPSRMEKTPYWLSSSKIGVYGKPAPEDFLSDYEHWKRVVTNSYKNGLGINWSTVRNVMDMRAVYGGLAAALIDFNVWVMNIVSVDASDTLPIIYERGLFGIYHDWCESFSTYPRSYDLLHSDHLFSQIKQRCNATALVSEVDRILRPRGGIIVRDTTKTINELENMFRSMQWTIQTIYSKNNEGLLYAQKSMWRPKEVETVTYGIK